MSTSRLVGAAGALTIVGTLVVTGLIREEGLRLRPYYDVVHKLTKCIGDTENVKITDVETRESCIKLLMKRLPDYEQPMRRCLKNPDAIPGKTFASFFLLTYNIGTGAFCRSSVVRAANAGNLYQACDNILKFNKAGGRVVKGLVLRRTRERALCIDGIDEPVTLYPDEGLKQ